MNQMTDEEMIADYKTSKTILSEYLDDQIGELFRETMQNIREREGAEDVLSVNLKIVTDFSRYLMEVLIMERDKAERLKEFMKNAGVRALSYVIESVVHEDTKAIEKFVFKSEGVEIPVIWINDQWMVSFGEALMDLNSIASKISASVPGRDRAVLAFLHELVSQLNLIGTNEREPFESFMQSFVGKNYAVSARG